jgi:hypothetical protein
LFERFPYWFHINIIKFINYYLLITLYLYEFWGKIQFEH